MLHLFLAFKTFYLSILAVISYCNNRLFFPQCLLGSLIAASLYITRFFLTQIRRSVNSTVLCCMYKELFKVS